MTAVERLQYTTTVIASLH